jgi:DNA-binding MarR family transcriptional regulator
MENTTDHSIGDEVLHGGCLNTLMRQAARRMTLIYDIGLASTGLTAAQARLIAVVAELDDPDGQGPVLQSVGRRMGLEVSALTHALRPLQKDGLLSVTRGLADGRNRHARLTPKGAAQLDRMMVLYAATNKRIDAVLGAEQASALRRLAGEVLSPSFAAAMLAPD